MTTPKLLQADLTNVWPKKDYPLIEVGVMEFNRTPDNVFAELEQAASSPDENRQSPTLSARALDIFPRWCDHELVRTQKRSSRGLADHLSSGGRSFSGSEPVPGASRL